MIEITLPILLQILQTVALIVGIFYYLTIMRNSQRNQQMQLETRQAQLFMNTYLHATTEEAMKADFDLLKINLNSVEDWNELLEDKERYISFNIWAMYFEGIGVLVRKQLVDIDDVVRLLSGMILAWWEKYRVVIIAMREHYDFPRAMIEAEFLYNRVVEYGREHPELGIAAPPLYQPKKE